MKGKRRHRSQTRRIRKPGTGRPRVYDAVPSPQAMAKRQILAEGGDPTKTTIPLDLLEMRGIISMSQSEVGRVYGWLRRMIYCSAPGSLDTSLSHAAGLIEIAACHA